MNIMNTPQFLITSYLESTQNNLEELRKKLFEKGVLTKDYIDDGLMLLYHKYDSPITSELERECRSLIIDRTALKIKSYSCETPRLNKEGMEYLVAKSAIDSVSTNPNQIINTCYEGTYLSLFNHNTKWYVSTRRCLNSQESVFTQPKLQETENKNQKSHYEMFEDIIKKAGYHTFNDFTSKLDVLKSYYFVLIHHQNKLLIDYTSIFGTDYGRICLTTIRDSEMRELDIYSEHVDFASYDKSGIIFVPEKLESINDFANSNKLVQYNQQLECEGIVVRVWNELMNKYHLIKLQNINYQFALVLGSEGNIFKGLVYLYQTDKLVDYFNQNPLSQNIKKIVNPLNTSESYDTVGIIDSVFKVCTSELFELFKILWSLKNCQHQNKELYDMMPKEYKDVLFAIRGMYYKKKAPLHTGKKELLSQIDFKNTHLKINDIYNYLKSLSTETFIAFLRMRKLMFNWVKIESSNKVLSNFSSISNHCDRVHIKLCAIFTNKLYPNIMPNDVPPQKESHQESEILISTN